MGYKGLLQGNWLFVMPDKGNRPCKAHLEGWEGRDSLVDILVVGGKVLGPVQHLCCVVYKGLLG